MLELAALSLPIKVDDNTWIDITILKAITNQSVPTEFDYEERSQEMSIGTKLERQLIYKYTDRKKKPSESSTLLTVTTYPLLRYGHWCISWRT